MAKCKRCKREVCGDDIYSLKEEPYCEHCAIILQKQSKSASVTGYGCSGPNVPENSPRD
ncbi:MAG: hypothetical protein U0M15_00565 [Bacillota bacterium]|nr:hypothetical protein [Bacillota bacterium]